MLSRRKSQIAGLLIVALVAGLTVGALTISAQEDTDDDTTPCPCGRGPLGRGVGGMFGQWADADHPMLDITAEALGMDVEELLAELQDGQTLAEIAEAQGVDLQVVVDAHLAEMTERLAEMVEDGRLTQDQADALRALMADRLLERFSGEYGLGFWGSGHGMGFGRGPQWGNGRDRGQPRRGGQGGWW